ncbi:MAG TPA: hypothetical protein VMK65_09230, partial [Longimicrobiales bacterium]|nr:hypothetical protein [Longimicrobiales bacterium]
MQLRRVLSPLLLAVLAGAPAAAQRLPQPALDPEMAAAANSAFALEIPDIAVSGVRSPGYTTGCVTNAAVAHYFQFGCASPLYNQVVSTANPDSLRMVGQFFDLGLLWAAPPSDLPEGGAVAPLGGGWTVTTTSRIAPPYGGSDKIRPSGSGLLAPGVVTTEDGSCTDFRSAADGYIRVGHPLLPVSDCPVTHPASGWAGRPHAAPAALLTWRGLTGDDPFATWRLPDATGPGTRGDWHTYGEASDHTPELLALYGGVTPRDAGEPAYAGWPLGLTVRFDAFQHHIEPAARAWYWDGLLINRSEEVWGTAQAYDSLYLGLYFSVINGYEVHYFDGARSALLFNAGGDGCVGHPEPPGLRCWVDSRGWYAGGWAIAVLRSPIGDM